MIYFFLWPLAGLCVLCYDLGYRAAKRRRPPPVLIAILTIWIAWPALLWDYTHTNNNNGPPHA